MPGRLPPLRLAWVARAVAIAAATALAAASAIADGTAPAPPAPPPPPPAGTPSPTAPAVPSSPAAAVPKIAFDRETHDFGVLRQETTNRTTITIRNDGGAVLHVSGIRADCGCTTFSAAARVLAPGASAPIQVTLHTYTMAGPLSKRLIVASDDPARPSVEIHLKADIAAGIVLEPGRLFFGNVLLGTAPSASATLKWREGVGRRFAVTSVEMPEADLAVETKAFDAAPWHGVTVTARFSKPTTAIRSIATTALVRTDDPDYPSIVVPVTAWISGKVWVSARELKAGMLPRGAGRTMVVNCGGITKDTALGKVTAKARGGRVEARAVPDASGGWVVEVKVPAGAAPGPLDDVVEVACSIPGEPPAEIHVTALVLDGPK